MGFSHNKLSHLHLVYFKWGAAGIALALLTHSQPHIAGGVHNKMRGGLGTGQRPLQRAFVGWRTEFFPSLCALRTQWIPLPAAFPLQLWDLPLGEGAYVFPACFPEKQLTQACRCQCFFCSCVSQLQPGLQPGLLMAHSPAAVSLMTGRAINDRSKRKDINTINLPVDQSAHFSLSCRSQKGYFINYQLWKLKM